MIYLKHITKTYQKSGAETHALTDISVEIEQGEFVAIMGQSGCGKSTLLNILGMLDSPSSGDYLLMGQKVSKLKERELAKLRKKNIGFIFQNFNLVDELSVQDNIEMALLYQSVSIKERKDKVAEVMDKVGIAHRAHHLPHELSGGQQQRVAIARAIVAEPKLILADEPTGNLDSAHGHDVMNSLRALNEQGTTIVMVTHSPAHADYARRTINLFDGRLLSQNLKQAVITPNPNLKVVG